MRIPIALGERAERASSLYRGRGEGRACYRNGYKEERRGRGVKKLLQGEMGGLVMAKRLFLQAPETPNILSTSPQLIFLLFRVVLLERCVRNRGVFKAWRP